MFQRWIHCNATPKRFPFPSIGVPCLVMLIPTQMGWHQWYKHHHTSRYDVLWVSGTTLGFSHAPNSCLEPKTDTGQVHRCLAFWRLPMTTTHAGTSGHTHYWCFFSKLSLHLTPANTETLWWLTCNAHAWVDTPEPDASWADWLRW